MCLHIFDTTTYYFHRKSIVEDMIELSKCNFSFFVQYHHHIHFKAYFPLPRVGQYIQSLGSC